MISSHTKSTPRKPISPKEKQTTPFKKPLGILSFDTELTGIDLWHGCRPFFFSSSQQGTLRWTEWPVDPFTRIPKQNPQEVLELLDLLSTHQIVGHNIKIDLRALDVVHQDLSDPSVSSNPEPTPLEINWSQVHDTLTASHVLRNLWSHSLKDLREIFLCIDNRRQMALRTATNKARSICRRKDFIAAHGQWRIADSNDPHWPGIKRAPRDKGSTADDDAPSEGWWICDTWLPAAICENAPDFLPPENECLHDGNDWFLHPWQTVLKQYALEDADSTLLLWQVLEDALKQEDLWEHYLNRLRLLQVDYEMESHGLHVDTDPESPTNLIKEIRRYKRESSRREHIAKLSIDQPSLNLASPKQLSKVLYEDLRLPVMKTTKPSKTYPKGQPSTDAETIEQLQSVLNGSSSNSYNTEIATPFLRNLLLSRRNEKAADYLDSYREWLVGSRIHAIFNNTGTKFTRQSISNPNLQNIGTGKKVDEMSDEELMDYNLRVVYRPPPGKQWWDYDYDNQELRLWAYDCGNRELIRAFETGQSVHIIIFRVLWPRLAHLTDKEIKERPEYKWTKNGNFSIIYGASPAKADATYRQTGAYNKLSSQFPEVKRFTTMLHDQVATKGYINTLGGFRLYIPKNEPHKAVSGRIQGSAAEAKANALVECFDSCQTVNQSDMEIARQGGIHPILEVHDEIVFEVPNLSPEYGITFQQRLKLLMERQGEKIGIPLPVSGKIITTNWSQSESMCL